MKRLVCIVVMLAPVLGACGLRGDLARPPPVFGDDRRAYEAQRAEEAARAQGEAKAEQDRRAAAAAAAAAPTP